MNGVGTNPPSKEFLQLGLLVIVHDLQLLSIDIKPIQIKLEQVTTEIKKQ